jgi:DNA polymerase III psi subunit
MNVTAISGVNQSPPTDMNLNTSPIANNFNLTVVANGSFSSNEAFMADVIKGLESFGFNVSSALALNTTNLTGNLSIQQALNNFVHSLQVALNQADNIASSQNTQASTQTQVGFNNFIDDLIFLIGSSNNNALLQSNNNLNSSSLLQSNFNSFLNLLSLNTSSASVTPSLSDLLSVILINLQTDQVNQNSIGTSLNTQI